MIIDLYEGFNGLVFGYSNGEIRGIKVGLGNLRGKYGFFNFFFLGSDDI